MSKYEDYSEVSKVYDKERTAMGADTIAGLLHVYGGKPLKDLHVLDAGCGTGNYAKALIEFGVGKITLLDASKDMLAVAKEKLKTEIDNGIVDKVVEAKMPPLPFEDGSFDVVLFSLVLHHLEEVANGEDFPVIEKMFTEAKRVTKAGGILFIIESLPSTIKNALWFGQLNKELCDRYCKHFPSVRQFLNMLETVKYKCVSKFNILGLDSYANYVDPEGPLRKDWRKGVSFFAVATDEEIKDIENKVLAMTEAGTITQYIEEHERIFEIGLLTILTCVSL